MIRRHLPFALVVTAFAVAAVRGLRDHDYHAMLVFSTMMWAMCFQFMQDERSRKELVNVATDAVRLLESLADQVDGPADIRQMALREARAARQRDAAQHVTRFPRNTEVM